MNITDKNLMDAFDACSVPEREAITAMLRREKWQDVEALRRTLRKIRAKLKRKARRKKL